MKWQKTAQVRLQLKFAFIIYGPKCGYISLQTLQFLLVEALKYYLSPGAGYPSYTPPLVWMLDLEVFIAASTKWF